MRTEGTEPVFESGVVARFKTEQVDLVVVSLSLRRDSIAAIDGLLSAQEHERSSRFHRERDRARFKSAHACLRQLIGERLAIAPRKIEFARNEHGKPHLASVDSGVDLQFNMSYAGDTAVFALATDAEVGVDAELVRTVPEADCLARRHFTPAEYAAYSSLDTKERTLGFLNCWTRKEALAKALGRGLQIPLTSLEVSLKPGAPAEIIGIDKEYGIADEWALLKLPQVNGLAIAAAVQMPIDEPRP